jgi:Domain of unknown function (DUF4189)
MSAKTKTLFVLGLLSVCNLAFAENGCPDGMTPFQNGGDPAPKCYPIQGGQNTSPARPTHWIDAYVAIAWHPDSPDVWAVWNTRNEQGGYTGTQNAAIALCAKSMGDDRCTSPLANANGSIAVARRNDGALLMQYGATARNAKENVLKDCVVAKVRCVFVRSFTAKPWVEYADGGSETRFDKMETYDPAKNKGGIKRNLYGAAAWTPGTSKVYASGGHSSRDEASKAVVDFCKKDSGAECPLADNSINGVIVTAIDEKSIVWMVSDLNFSTGEKFLLSKCKEAKTKCSIVMRFDAKKAGASIYDVFAASR